MERLVELIRAMLGVFFQEGTSEYAVICFNIWLWKDVCTMRGLSNKTKRQAADMLETKLLRQHDEFCRARHGLERKQSFRIMSERVVHIFESLDSNAMAEPGVGKRCWRVAFLYLANVLLSWFIGSFRRQTTTSERLLKVVAMLCICVLKTQVCRAFTIRQI